MNIEHKPINHEDDRGIIRDIIAGTAVDSVSLITCKKGSVRSNHYHKETTQYTYVVSGKFTYACQMEGGPVETREVAEGDITKSLPGERHAFKALEDSVLLQLSHGPRQGMDYEKDTYRLETPILT